jgi:hypothetical protein
MTPTLDYCTLNVLERNFQPPVVLFIVRTLAKDLKDNRIVWGGESQSFRWSHIKDGFKISFHELSVPSLERANLSLINTRPVSLSLDPSLDTICFSPQKSDSLLRFNIKQFKKNEMLREDTVKAIGELYVDLEGGSIWVE